MTELVQSVIIGVLLGLLIYFAVLKPRYRSKRAVGQIVISMNPETGNKVFTLELDKSPEEIETMRNVSFNVNHQNGESP